MKHTQQDPIDRLRSALVQVTFALVEFEQARQRLSDAVAAVIGSPIPQQAGVAPAAPAAPAAKERRISDAGRKAIAAAQKRRWAAKKAAEAQAEAEPKVKRKMSAQGRRNIRAALKKRWAAAKAAKRATGD